MSQKNEQGSPVKSSSKSPQYDNEYVYGNRIVLNSSQLPRPEFGDLSLILSMIEDQLEEVFEIFHDRHKVGWRLKSEIMEVIRDFAYTRDQQWHDYFLTGWTKDFERALGIKQKSDRKGGRPPENPHLFKRIAEIVLKDIDVSYTAAAKQAMVELGIRTKPASKDGKPARDPETYSANFKSWMNSHDHLHRNPGDLRVALMLLQLIIEKMDLK